MKKSEIEKILVVLDMDDIAHRYMELAYHFPRHEETIYEYFKEAYGVDLDDWDEKG